MAKALGENEYKMFPFKGQLLRTPPKATPSSPTWLTKPELPNSKELQKLSIEFVEGCREIDGAPKFINQFDIECSVKEGNIILDRETGRLKIDGITFPTEVEKVYTKDNKMYIKLRGVRNPIVVGQRIELPRELETTTEDVKAFKESCMQSGGDFYDAGNNWLCKIDGMVLSLRKHGIVYISGKVNAGTYLQNIKLEDGKIIINVENGKRVINI